MTPQERAFWLRAQRRVAAMTPEVRDAILRAFEIIRENLSARELAAIVESGNLDRLFAEALSDRVINRAFLPMRMRMRQNVEREFKYFTNDLPAGGAVDGTLAVAFNVLNPAIIDAIRALDSKVMTTLRADIRETVRAFIAQGLKDGLGPRTIARGLRDVVGLSPTQAQYVRNLRAELENGEYATAARRQLLDARFNLTKLDALSAAERAKRIDTIVSAYRKSYIAFNAETNARTASLDAMKLGQRLSWQEAIDLGIVDGTRLKKTWIGVMDSRERPEHVAMQGETVGFDGRFSNGELICGDSTFNCRCVPRYWQAPPMTPSIAA